MIRKFVYSVFLCAVCLGVSNGWAADIRYVADQLVITLREGKGNEYKVIKTLKTDTPMEVLEEDGRYLRVRLEDGTHGYVLKQYISLRIPKSEQIKELKLEVERLRTQVEEQQDAVETKETLLKELNTLRQELAVSEQELARIRELSDNALMLDKERKRLQQDLDEVQAQLSTLQEENRTMLSSASIRWFLAGGGTLLFGWVLGKFSRRKQRGSFSRF